MEGVGARLGRSSTRYGPAAVFSGPVRMWKKKWVPLSSPSNNNTSNNGNSSSHLLLYKWAPISPNPSYTDAKNGTDPAAPPEEPARRKFRYVPVYVIEEQKQEAAAKSDDENKPIDVDQSPQPTEPDGKPDITMEESQALNKDQEPVGVAKETNLDLSLGLKSHDGDSGNETKMGEQGESSSAGGDVEMISVVTDSEVGNRTKTTVVPDLQMRV